MQHMVDGLQSSMRLLVASVRSPDDIVALASQVTNPFETHSHGSRVAICMILQVEPSYATCRSMRLVHMRRGATPSQYLQTAPISCSRSS